VKRQGKASKFLHSHVHVGDTIKVSKPSGYFFLQESSDRPLVLLSNGIGATPLVSMLHHIVSSTENTNAVRKIYWLHGAKDSQHHTFKAEVEELQSLAADSVILHVAYSQPLEKDQGFDSRGRLCPLLLQELIPELTQADIYMCGSDAFVAEMEEGLRKLHVPDAHIRYETF
jgi:ferredoxin-NADP reductase